MFGHYLLEYFFNGMRRNTEFCKSGPLRGRNSVDLHQFDLIAGNGGLRKQFRHPREGMPCTKGKWHPY